MNKREFLNDLDSKLDFLTEEERNKTINYYSEIIEDRIESGASEEEAVLQTESTEVIAKKLMTENNTQKNTSEKVLDFIDKLFEKHGYLFMLVIAILSIPLWTPILGGVLGLVCAIFLLLFGMIAFGAVGSVISLILAISYITQSLLYTISTLGASMFCAGFAILVTIGTVKLINMMSNFFKKVSKSIKEHSEKRRNSKWIKTKKFQR